MGKHSKEKKKIKIKKVVIFIVIVLILILGCNFTKIAEEQIMTQNSTSKIALENEAKKPPLTSEPSVVEYIL